MHTHTSVLFAFDVYDRNKSGVLDVEEGLKMMKDVYGDMLADNVNALRYTAYFTESTTHDILFFICLPAYPLRIWIILHTYIILTCDYIFYISS